MGFRICCLCLWDSCEISLHTSYTGDAHGQVQIGHHNRDNSSAHTGQIIIGYSQFGLITITAYAHALTIPCWKSLAYTAPFIGMHRIHKMEKWDAHEPETLLRINS